MNKQAELEQAYWNGFATKCAEMGVDAEALVKEGAPLGRLAASVGRRIPDVGRMLVRNAPHAGRYRRSLAMLTRFGDKVGRGTTKVLDNTAGRLYDKGFGRPGGKLERLANWLPRGGQYSGSGMDPANFLDSGNINLALGALGAGAGLSGAAAYGLSSNRTNA